MSQQPGTEAVDPGERPEDTEVPAVLGGRVEPADGDPTAGGRTGQAGDADPGSDPNAASIAADEPTDGGPAIPVAGGSPGEEPDEVPHAAPGPTDD